MKKGQKEGTPPALYKRTCAWCGMDYLAKASNQKYCSQKCYEETKNQRSREQYEQKRQASEKRKKQEPNKGVEILAKAAGMSYGQYRATGGKKPVPIEEKYDAPVRNGGYSWGTDWIPVHEEKPAPPAKIRRRIKIPVKE